MGSGKVMNVALGDVGAVSMENLSKCLTGLVPKRQENTRNYFYHCLDEQKLFIYVTALITLKCTSNALV
jgi:hypothetical protein